MALALIPGKSLPTIRVARSGASALCKLQFLFPSHSNLHRVTELELAGKQASGGWVHVKPVGGATRHVPRTGFRGAVSLTSPLRFGY